jgi:hypothetical protein
VHVYRHQLTRSHQLPGGQPHRGQIVGQHNSSLRLHGFPYDDGMFITLTTPGAISTDAFAINDHGEAIGFYVCMHCPSAERLFRATARTLPAQ